MLYTKSAADRIITASTKIEAVREFKNCIQVTYKIGRARCSTFVSKAKFAADFVEFRKAAAAGLKVTGHGTRFLVHNDASNTSNVVDTIAKTCTCKDFHEQVAANIRALNCKHFYAAQNFIQQSKVIQFGRPAPDYVTTKSGRRVAIG